MLLSLEREDATVHSHSVVLPYHGASGTWGSGDRVGDKLTASAHATHHLFLQSLRLIRQHGLSAAIFAPGWVYEHLGEENFLQNENK